MAARSRRGRRESYRYGAQALTKHPGNTALSFHLPHPTAAGNQLKETGSEVICRCRVDRSVLKTQPAIGD